MLTYWTCEVTTVVDDDDVREALGVGDDYEVTNEDRASFAWENIEDENCEYGMVKQY